ncbi:MAG: signal peptidase I [Candidatus Thorarchaeota archaeon]
MERAKSVLKWNERSETAKTLILVAMVVGGTAAGYGLFMFATGTTTPLVVVTSESMVPTLNVGDLLVLRRVPADQIHEGDIIVYQDTWYTGAPIVHRVVRIEDVDGVLHFYTKGDANSVEDPGDRTYDEIVGVVVLTIPWVGNISLWLRSLLSTPIGIVTIILIFGLILFGPELFARAADTETEESKSDATNSEDHD